MTAVHTVSENTGLQEFPADVDGFRAGGSLSVLYQPVHKLFAYETLFICGEVVFSVLYQLATIPVQPGERSEGEMGQFKLATIPVQPGESLEGKWVNFKSILQGYILYPFGRMT